MEYNSMPDQPHNRPSSNPSSKGEVLPKTVINPNDPKQAEAAKVIDAPKDKSGVQSTNPISALSGEPHKVEEEEPVKDTSKRILEPRPNTEPRPATPESLLPAPNVVVTHNPDDPSFRNKMTSGKDWDKALAHLNEVRRNVMKREGKVGFNPFIWLATYVEPLEKRLRAAQHTDGLYNEIIALDKDPDVSVK